MDGRTYIRLHDGMPDHPKVVGLSDAAFRLYVESLCWCSRHLTDGAVTVPAMKPVGGGSPEAAKELAGADLFEPDGVTGNWLVHDYIEHQRTSDEVAEFRESKRLAGVTGNHERWHVARQITDPSCELCAIGDVSHVRSVTDGVRESHQRSQTHRKTSPTTETDTDKEERKRLAHTGTDQDPDFTAFWAAYPRKIGKGQARKAWRSVIIGSHVDPKVIITAAEQFRDECRRRGTDQQYIPHPTTWLNGERYNDTDAQSAGRFQYPTSPYAN